MTYELHFHPDALEEWRGLDKTIREQLKKRLAQRLSEPRVPASRLAGRPNRYKIKLRSAGIRLIYEVRETELFLLVVAVEKRERNTVYESAAKR